MTTPSETGELDLNDPTEFAKALSRECPRPFTFGPIEFDELNLSPEEKAFNAEHARQSVIDCLDLHMPQPSCCIRGHTISIKERNFKRRSTMLKHGRFMRNMQVVPVYPKPVIEEDDEGEEDLGDGASEQ